VLQVLRGSKVLLVSPVQPDRRESPVLQDPRVPKVTKVLLASLVLLVHKEGPVLRE
jgi:hypothetical protein